jgi:hypothetical protein
MSCDSINENQGVGGRGKAVADAELDAQWIGLVVDHREKGLPPPARRLQAAQLAVICVMLERQRPTFGEIVSHPSLRREIQRTQSPKRTNGDRRKNAVSNRANSLLYVWNGRREMRDPYDPLMS